MIGKFFRAVWRFITALRLALANLLFLAALVLLWLLFTGEPAAPLPDRAALVLDPAGVVVDRRSRVDALSLLSAGDGADGEVLLADLIDAVDLASEDARVTALVLDLDGLLYIGQSKTLELAQAIARFRGTGKPVVATGDYYSQDQYRLAVEADHILMHPLGAVALEGYSAYMNYFREALEKLAVDVHVFRAGEHKSLGDPFLRNDMSAEEKALTGRWLQVLWENYTRDVERRRDLPPGTIDGLLNDHSARLAAAGSDPARLAMATGLVDELLQRDQARAFVASLVQADDGEGGYEKIYFDEYLQREGARSRPADAAVVAVVSAQGTMLPGDVEGDAIGGDSLAALLRDAAEMPKVEAIVLRVNSGGGSVFAAEIIRAEIERIRAEGTPVVVSMGAVAASGGYYIAAEADAIYATEATLTGSIGVFLAFPTVDRLLARGGIHTDGVGTTALAGGLRPDRALAPEVAQTLQQSVDRIHDDFVALVARGREMPESEVRALADGRVFAASDALAAGLVDEIGGLRDAVAFAAQLAGLSDYESIDVTPPMTPQQMFLQRLGKLVSLPAALTAAAEFSGISGASAGHASAPGPASTAALLSRGIPAWLTPLVASARLLEEFRDPRHLYVRCLSCPSG